ncbi:alcohol dehydrogenase catalytic domain-containing protein [Leucobacter weissii]|uniref:Alcohol dehydrogenase catalytic domain-containing protein n=1 Tax=Leucobacter weissii TaxID=1983706 RepID=A0A939SDA2_9MICO|nr:alcohol dehydrogenase catalytic domain-containing protein [Leucobacter weissii]MBO1903235.1 alcohol dehydrogenase catalytic domain-containing protein [Leucobacter weissii]
MKAVVKSRAEHGADFVTDLPEPEVGATDVLLEVAAASVCGTDRELYEWTPSAQAFNLRLPNVLGHEISGTVIEVGKDVTRFEVGDRLALESHVPCYRCYPCSVGDAHNCTNMLLLGMHIDGGFAERTAVPESVGVKLPDSVSLEVGSLMESAGVAWTAIARSGFAVNGANVLVSGCGPVGLVVIQLSILLGAASVVAIEPNPYRRRIAESLGATVLDPFSDDVVAHCRNLNPWRGGVDVAFEVSAAPSALPTLLESVRREGDVVTIGHPSSAVPIDIAAHINKKGITLRGVFGRRLWSTWEGLSQMLESGRLDLSWLITHRLELDKFEHAIELLTGDANKVVLFPNGVPARG